MNTPNSLDAWKHLNRRDNAMRDLFDALLVGFQPNIVCDVGSYNGDEAARFRSLLSDAHIFIFEGSKQNIDRYISPREDLKFVNIHHTAVSDHDGETTFYILEAREEGIDWRRMANSLNPRVDGHEGVPVIVPCTTLDSFFQNETGGDKTFALWIDVEGALDQVIRGAESVLQQTVLLKVEIERKAFWEGQILANEVVSLIESKGFISLGDTYFEGASEQSDVLFINRRWLDMNPARQLES